MYKLEEWTNDKGVSALLLSVPYCDRLRATWIYDDRIPLDVREGSWGYYEYMCTSYPNDTIEVLGVFETYEEAIKCLKLLNLMGANDE